MNAFEELISRLSKPLPQKSPESIKTVYTGVREVCSVAVDMIISFERMYRIGSDGMVYPYHDAVGYPTIGVGHLLSKVKWEDLYKYPAITLHAAHELHKRDLDKFAVGVMRLLKISVSDNQFGALVSLAFNIGLGNLQASTLMRKLNRNEQLIDIADEFLKWNKAGGKVLRGLTRRRIAERNLFLSET